MSTEPNPQTEVETDRAWLIKLMAGRKRLTIEAIEGMGGEVRAFVFCDDTAMESAKTEARKAVSEMLRSMATILES